MPENFFSPCGKYIRSELSSRPGVDPNKSFWARLRIRFEGFFLKRADIDMATTYDQNPRKYLSIKRVRL